MTTSKFATRSPLLRRTPVVPPTTSFETTFWVRGRGVRGPRDKHKVLRSQRGHERIGGRGKVASSRVRSSAVPRRYLADWHRRHCDGDRGELDSPGPSSCRVD